MLKMEILSNSALMRASCFAQRPHFEIFDRRSCFCGRRALPPARDSGIVGQKSLKFVILIENLQLFPNILNPPFPAK